MLILLILKPCHILKHASNEYGRKVNFEVQIKHGNTISFLHLILFCSCLTYYLTVHLGTT